MLRITTRAPGGRANGGVNAAPRFTSFNAMTKAPNKGAGY